MAPNNRLPLKGINPLPLRNVQPKGRAVANDDRQQKNNAAPKRQSPSGQGRGSGFGSAMARYADARGVRNNAGNGSERQSPINAPTIPSRSSGMQNQSGQDQYIGQQYAAGTNIPSYATEKIEDDKTPLTGQKEEEKKPASESDTGAALADDPRMKEGQAKAAQYQQMKDTVESASENADALRNPETPKQNDKDTGEQSAPDYQAYQQTWGEIPFTPGEPSEMFWFDIPPLRYDDPAFTAAEDYWVIPSTPEEAERYRSQPFDQKAFEERSEGSGGEESDANADSEYSANVDSTEAYFMSVKDELDFERDYSDIVDMQLNGTEADWLTFVSQPEMTNVYGPEIMGDAWDGQTIAGDAFSSWFWDNRNNNDFYGAIDNLDAETLYRMYGTDYDLMNRVMQQYDPGYAGYYGYSEASPENTEAFYDNLIANSMASLIGGDQGLTFDDLFTLDQLNDMTRLDNWTYGEGEGYDTNVNPDFDTWDEIYATMNGVPEEITAEYPYWVDAGDGTSQAVSRAVYEQQNGQYGPDGLMLPFWGDPNYITAMTGYGRKEK